MHLLKLPKGWKEEKPACACSGRTTSLDHSQLPDSLIATNGGCVLDERVYGEGEGDPKYKFAWCDTDPEKGQWAVCGDIPDDFHTALIDLPGYGGYVGDNACPEGAAKPAAEVTSLYSIEAREHFVFGGVAKYVDNLPAEDEPADWRQVPPKPDGGCCEALTAPCIACELGVTPHILCRVRSDTLGCKPWNPPPVTAGCCKALIASCLSCAVGITSEEWCEVAPETIGCEDSRNADENENNTDNNIGVRIE